MTRFALILVLAFAPSLAAAPVLAAPAVAQGQTEDGARKEPRIVYVGEPQQDKSHRWLFLAGGVLVLSGIYLAIKAKNSESALEKPEGESDDDR